ncbi:MAG: peptidase M15 [Ponticaulis sp.]|nr:peptidase M15 [Ponticaulis sp.]
MRRILMTSLMMALCACSHADEGDMVTDPADRPEGFVNAQTYIHGLQADMRYFGDDNFIGRPIDGYDAPICYLTIEAAEALSKVQAELSGFGLGLKVFDCYRPASAVADFAAWARDLDDEKMKAKYYPEVEKSRLFELGYIAERSGHSRGSTMDLTIIELSTGEELDMGSRYDLFDPLSWPSDPRPTAQQRGNRALIQSVMLSNGFRGIKEEWWHFTLNNEPYPDTYFDFPVK